MIGTSTYKTAGKSIISTDSLQGHKYFTLVFGQSTIQYSSSTALYNQGTTIDNNQIIVTNNMMYLSLKNIALVLAFMAHSVPTCMANVPLVMEQEQMQRVMEQEQRPLEAFDCVTKFAALKFDIFDFQRYNKYFRNTSTVTLPPAGTYEGIEDIEEYVRFAT